jgi:hypothetical protein
MDVFKTFKEEGVIIVRGTYNQKNIAFSSQTIFLKNGKIDNHKKKGLL